MVEALEVMAASVEALPGGDIGGMAGSAEIMPGGNYETIDMYTDGAESMYCTWCVMHDEERRSMLDKLSGNNSSFGQIKPTKMGFVVPYGDSTRLGGEVHDTYKVIVDRISGGHTTFNIPGFDKKRITHP